MTPRKKGSAATDLLPWAEAVATRADVSVEVARAALERWRIHDDVPPTRPSPLTVTRLAFSGVKAEVSDAGPFEFAWPLGTGVWGILSDQKNFAGKTSVMEVLLWALRGEPRASLTPNVRSWIRSVQVDFRIGTEGHRLAFTSGNGVQGSLVADPGGRERELFSFKDEATFKAHMDRFMLHRFRLEPIPATLKVGTDTAAQAITHSWPAYAGSLFIGGNSDAILGDTVMGQLPVRLLQMFLGMPYARTRFAAAAAVRLMESRMSEARAARAAEETKHLGEIGRLKTEIRDLERQFSALPTVPTDVRVTELLTRSAESSAEVIALDREIADAAATREAAVRAFHEDQRRHLLLKESRDARSFFTGLDPVCCPRCKAAFQAERHVRETDTGHCAVCDRAAPPDDREELDAQLAELHASIRALRQASDDAATSERRLTARREAAASDAAGLAAEVAALKGAAAALPARQALYDSLLMRRGALAERERMIETSASMTDPDLVVAKAAEAEAKHRTDAVKGAILNDLNTAIRDLARSFGVDELAEVDLRLNGTMSLRIGGRRARSRVAPLGSNSGSGSPSSSPCFELRTGPERATTQGSSSLTHPGATKRRTRMSAHSFGSFAHFETRCLTSRSSSPARRRASSPSTS